MRERRVEGEADKRERERDRERTRGKTTATAKSYILDPTTLIEREPPKIMERETVPFIHQSLSGTAHSSALAQTQTCTPLEKTEGSFTVT